MIDLYTANTPNGKKASIMLEEVGLDYIAHPVNLQAGEQFNDDYVLINPNSKIPAIIDGDGPGGKQARVFESGAILIYLAEKCGRTDLWPTDGLARYAVLEWLMWQMSAIGPMCGQALHFLKFAKEDVPAAKERFGNEVKRLFGVMDRQLGKTAYLAGDVFTIADIATYPWIDRRMGYQVNLDDYPNVRRWYETVSARESVEAGMQVPQPFPG
ncbi:MAG: glutathione S-transferase family protein [Alphaproteobacteria bacterium]|nr:glutathione S-transferase family protein [Alphaproteobacteria bacterium]MBF0250263.1 glutathione S-transferase family protein [Alphaproteobacteria bacterium]